MILALFLLVAPLCRCRCFGAAGAGVLPTLLLLGGADGLAQAEHDEEVCDRQEALGAAVQPVDVGEARAVVRLGCALLGCVFLLGGG